MEIDCGFTKGDRWFRYRAAGIIVEDGYVLFAGNDVDDYLYSVGGGVHVGETAEEAVVREVFEETGVHYEVDRLAFIHENFFVGGSGTIEKLHCHELTFYFLMKPMGTRQLNSHSSTSAGVAEHMHWVRRPEEADRLPHLPARKAGELATGNRAYRDPRII